MKSSFKVFLIQENLPSTEEIKKIIKMQPLLQARGHKKVKFKIQAILKTQKTLKKSNSICKIVSYSRNIVKDGLFLNWCISLLADNLGICYLDSLIPYK